MPAPGFTGASPTFTSPSPPGNPTPGSEYPGEVPLPSSLRRVRTAARRLKRAIEAERIAFWRSRPIRRDQVLYESFAGNGVLCNPEAIFRRLLDDPAYAHLRHVWVIADDAAIARFRAEFAGHDRVSFVRRGSASYRQALAVSGWLVNNATFPTWFGKREGQVYLNTWHGTPLKLMGFDMPSGAVQSANTLRNFLMADYLLAANPFMAETMYEHAYRLTNVYPGAIVEEGYPRIDRQHLDAPAEEAVRAELESDGLILDGKPIVLFAPTWRGSTFDDPEDNIDELELQLQALQAGVGDEYVVVLKTHQIVHARAADRPELARSLAPNTIPTNVLLGASAGLVTDYSSIFFDYLATGRPVAFFTPDADLYSSGRGTYMPLDTLPGPVSDDAEATGRALRALLADGAQPHPQYASWAERFTPFDDGGATARVVDIVFGGRTEGYRVRSAARDGRRRLLVYLGGMKPNGITTSAMNLLSALDPEKYDVTALLPKRRLSTDPFTQARIPSTVRQVFRTGGMNGSKAVHLRRRIDDWRGAPRQTGTEPWHENLWRAEWARVFGDARFDWVADFSGYGPLWTSLLLHAPAPEDGGPAPIRAVWMHNEMAADRERTVNGKAHMRRGLGAVFAMYRQYDELVSVSHQLTELNQVELAEYAPADRFRTARNFPDVEHVTRGMRRPLAEFFDDEDEEGIDGIVVPRPAWYEALQADEGELRWFITVGRLSPEKNHARLIRAFLEVHDEHPETRLLIVGGGPLRDELQQQIDDAGASDVAFLTGPQRNPYALLAASDCFVLSSLYEGQPMVLIEAAICSLPIVSTSFGSVYGALPEGAIRIVPQDDRALADGMRAFLAGEVPAAHLDVDAYRADVMAEFEALLDG